MTKNIKTILAIETSCDETAAAVLTVDSKKPYPQIKTLSSVINSQIKLHSKMGGVVPEVAARAHIKNILPVVKKTINDSQLTISDVDYVAVTAGPGLMPSLIVGVEFAKALALATNKPIIPVNHMLGHLYSPLSQLQVTSYKLQVNVFPIISLIVSGGHTMIVLMEDIKNYKVLGETVDDAAGEAFDKVAKLLKLPYPGGPEVSRLAEQSKNPVDFPRPMISSKNYNFSFSGLKTAVLYYLQSHQQISKSVNQMNADVCAGFQNAAVDVLVTKTVTAVKEFGAKSISLSGGVSANNSLREKLKVESKKLKVNFFVPETGLRTDNAEMIGLAAAFMLHNGFKPKKYNQIRPDSNLSL